MDRSGPGHGEGMGAASPRPLVLATALAAALVASRAEARAPASWPGPAPAPLRATVRTRLEVACTSEADLRVRLATLGVDSAVRADEAVALVDVTLREVVPASDRVVGELTVTSPRGVVLTRTFTEGCPAVREALLLAATHALERERELAVSPATEPAPAPVRDASTPWFGDLDTSNVPWPAPADPEEPPSASHVGEGGLAVFASGAFSATWSTRGVHALATKRFGRTRLGLAGAWASEIRDDLGVVASGTAITSRGWGARAGGVVGWGAPWNDGVLGFVAEGGITWGSAAGEARTVLGPDAALTGFGVCPNGGCGTTGPATTPYERTWLRPYLAWSLVLAVPLKKSPVRPVALVGGTTAPGDTLLTALALTGELGLVWQAF